MQCIHSILVYPVTSADVITNQWMVYDILTLISGCEMKEHAYLDLRNAQIWHRALPGRIKDVQVRHHLGFISAVRPYGSLIIIIDLQIN